MECPDQNRGLNKRPRVMYEVSNGLEAKCLDSESNSNLRMESRLDLESYIRVRVCNDLNVYSFFYYFSIWKIIFFYFKIDMCQQ